MSKDLTKQVTKLLTRGSICLTKISRLRVRQAIGEAVLRYYRKVSHWGLKQGRGSGAAQGTPSRFIWLLKTTSWATFWWWIYPPFNGALGGGSAFTRVRAVAVAFGVGVAAVAVVDGKTLV